jgi:peptide/nickel transport system permease protein
VPFEGGRLISIPLEFDYRYGAFPSEINLFLSASFEELRPFVRLTWQTPDGREFHLGGLRIARQDRVSISQSLALERQLGRVPHVGLLAAPDSDPPVVEPGRYRLRARGGAVRGGRSIEAELVVYGRVHGLAGPTTGAAT